MKKFSIIEAPLVSEEYFSGVSLMPEALLKAGLQKSLKAKITSKLPKPNWVSKRDPKTKIIDPEITKNYTIKIADAVEKDLASNYFPIVLGGDCIILVGSILGVRRKTNPGLFFIDGHADFYAPGISPSTETADMELGIVVGRDPEILSNIENKKPLVKESDVVLFGFRDEELIKQTGGEDVRKTKMQCVSLEDTRFYGFNNTLEKSLRNLLQEVDSFWIHLDLDVLDDKIMPAVDYRMPDGLTEGELVNTLQRLIHSGRALGISITIFNPTLDWDGSIAKRVVKLIAAGLNKQDKN